MNLPELRIDSAHRLRGIALTMFSIVSYAFMNMFIAMNSPKIGLTEQIFYRNLITVLIIGAVITAERRCGRRSEYEDWRKYAKHLTMRSIFGFTSMLLTFYALRNANKADVVTVWQMSIFTVPIVSSFLLGERLTRSFFPAAAAAFAGAFIAANPSFDSSSLPLLAAFGVALADTAVFTFLSYFSGRVNPLTTAFFFASVCTLISAPFTFASFAAPDAEDAFCLLMIGVSAAAAQITLTYSYLFMPAGEISVYNQTSIPINAAFAYLLLGEKPSMRTLICAVIVISASLFLFTSVKREKQAEQAKR